jgi:hypothetical protein
MSARPNNKNTEDRRNAFTNHRSLQARGYAPSSQTGDLFLVTIDLG